MIRKGEIQDDNRDYKTLADPQPADLLFHQGGNRLASEPVTSLRFTAALR